ncbi:MAG TPA: hypothetical protein VGI40_15590 [Pirellulaceae bacterium]
MRLLGPELSRASTLAPVSIWPRRSVEREIATLREEVRIYKEMVTALKAEREEVRKALDWRKGR